MHRLASALKILAPGFLLVSSLSWADPDIDFDMDLFQRKAETYVKNTNDNYSLAEDIAKEIVFLGREQIKQIPDDQIKKIVSDLTYISQFDVGGISAAMALGHIGPRAKCAIPVLLRRMKLSEELEKLHTNKTGARPYKFYSGAVQKIEPGLLPFKGEVTSVILDFERRNPQCKTEQPVPEH